MELVTGVILMALSATVGILLTRLLNVEQRLYDIEEYLNDILLGKVEEE